MGRKAVRYRLAEGKGGGGSGKPTNCSGAIINTTMEIFPHRKFAAFLFWNEAAFGDEYPPWKAPDR